jgi:hypothetical protein
MDTDKNRRQQKWRRFDLFGVPRLRGFEPPKGGTPNFNKSHPKEFAIYDLRFTIGTWIWPTI